MCWHAAKEPAILPFPPELTDSAQETDLHCVTCRTGLHCGRQGQTVTTRPQCTCDYHHRVSEGVYSLLENTQEDRTSH